MKSVVVHHYSGMILAVSTQVMNVIWKKKPRFWQAILLLASSTEKIPPTTKKKNPLVDARLHVRHMTVNDISRYEARLRDLNLLQRTDSSPDAPSAPVSKEEGARRLTDIDTFDSGHPLLKEIIELAIRVQKNVENDEGTSA
ncbi:hypothetical protein [Brenneria roseae]|uniref:hypothetical protein n=1 Tax=Brenneria roseae TaxID=1509241 RepID=UPI001B34A228|nr:hypothetical protein [Brenneria roseae]